MKVLITGANGMLASQVIIDLKRGYTEIGKIPTELENAEIICTDTAELDITDKSKCEEFILALKPDVIINCAAYTNVDGCETNQNIAFNVNAIGARNLAIAAQKADTKLIHLSTDYVFSGVGTVPFREYDEVNPVSAYGKTKLAGENYVKQYCPKSFIVRTAWLYGYYGSNFVKTMIRVGTQRKALTVVNDQIGNPTNAADLSHHILKLAVSDEYGTYHCTGTNECSWYDFASEIIKMANVDATVSPCTSAEYNSPTKRPEYSSLENMMLQLTVGDEMRDWKVALQSYFDNMPNDL